MPFPQETSVPIFPVYNKIPLTVNGHKDATTDPEQIRQWEQQHPNCAWAMPTGSLSGWGVVDFDFKEIDTQASQLNFEVGRFFKIVRPMGRLLVETQRGFHLYVPWTPEFGGNQRGETTHIDIRGEGGYAVLWGGDPGHAPKDEATAPQIIGFYRALKDLANTQKKAREPGAADVDLTIGEGEGRNEYLVRYAGSLRGLGKSIEQIKTDVRNENSKVCKPPLSEAELERTIFKSLERWEQGPVGKEARIVRVTTKEDYPPALGLDEIDLKSYYRSEGWWIPNFLPKNKLVVLFGEGGIGKSTLGVGFGRYVAEAGGRVLLIHTGEENIYSMAGKALASGIPKENVYIHGEGRNFTFPSAIKAFSEYLDEYKPDYVYIDNMLDVMDNEKNWENESVRTRSTLQPLASLTQQHNCTILLTSHKNKAGVYSGSTQIKAVVRHMLLLDDAGEQRAKLEVYKSNMALKGTKAYYRIEPVAITQHGEPLIKSDGRFAEETRMVELSAVDIDETEISVKEKVKFVINQLLNTHVQVTKAMINDGTAEVKPSTATISTAIKEMIDQGELVREGTTHRTLYRRPTLEEVAE